MKIPIFSRRILGLIRKEFILILRDKGTIGMLIVLPIVLLIVFGFAIELNPKHLPTAIMSYDDTPLTRNFISSLSASTYFNIVDTSNDVDAVNSKFQTGEISIAVTIPPNFTRKFIRKEKPGFLVELDGSDPGSNASAVPTLTPIFNQSAERFTKTGLSNANQRFQTRDANVIIHRLFNEANRSEFDIIPGLVGVLLTLTMVMLTSTAITSEFESGTMEMLLSTPLHPIEIILGKVFPYIILGYIQLTSILFFSYLFIHFQFHVMWMWLYIAAAPFILVNLMIGMIFSNIAQTPMQAMQLSVMFQLPSIFLSGYVFSFYGMPVWARTIGYALPVTYFNRIARGILVKDNTYMQILYNTWPIILIAVILVILTGKLFKTTLD